ncbi:MAG: cytochrome c biogenesis protein ResB [Planctomycetota bacterium]|nr:cytochrome c biogenesis protein ResB [Planctomycetota bacterium]
MFTLVSLIFILPQLFFPYFWTRLARPSAAVVTGSLAAVACAVGSLFGQDFAIANVYTAPWFIVIMFYFNAACFAAAVRFLFKSGKRTRLALAVLHLSFVVVCVGVAIDGFTQVRGYFKTSLKVSPDTMPPAMGYLQEGESSSELVVSRNDPGTELPFTLQLVSFTVDYFERDSVTLRVGGGAKKLAGFSFELKGIITDDGVEPDIPTSSLETARLAVEVSRNGKGELYYVPVTETALGEFDIAFDLNPDEEGDLVSDYTLTVTEPLRASKYTSVVNIIVDGETVTEGAKIEVNQPLNVMGYRIYQSGWGRFVTMEEWDTMPGNLRSPGLFAQYLETNDIPPTSFLMIARTPGRNVVYAGYLLMFLALIAFFAVRPSSAQEGGR